VKGGLKNGIEPAEHNFYVLRGNLKVLKYIRSAAHPIFMHQLRWTKYLITTIFPRIIPPKKKMKIFHFFSKKMSTTTIKMTI